MNDAMNTGWVSYKTGVVAASRVGFARVRFDDIDELESDWLPVVHPKTLQDKAIWTLDVGEHVACLMDQRMEAGCIVGAIYSDADVPPVGSKDKFRLQFKDGGSIEYDRSSGAMTVVCTGVLNATAYQPATIRAPRITLDTALTICTGDLQVLGSIEYQTGLSGAGGANIQGNLNVQGTVFDTDGNTANHTHN